MRRIRNEKLKKWSKQKNQRESTISNNKKNHNKSKEKLWTEGKKEKESKILRREIVTKNVIMKYTVIRR